MEAAFYPFLSQTVPGADLSASLLPLRRGGLAPPSLLVSPRCCPAGSGAWHTPAGARVSGLEKKKGRWVRVSAVVN